MKTQPAQLDSAEAWKQQRGRASGRAQYGGPGTGADRPVVTLGNVLHFVIAAFILWPIFLVIAVFVSLGDLVNFARYTVEAVISSSYWLSKLIQESMARAAMHRNDPAMQRLRGQRRALGRAAAEDWDQAWKALLGVGRAFSKTFGLGGLFASLEQRLAEAQRDWRRYVADAAVTGAHQPAEMPEQYVVVDELPQGGSTARLYVVRKADEGEGGRLYVLKYFNLRAGGHLESVVRESEAVKIAQRLGIILDSHLGEHAFWYVMPYYHGETLTRGVLRNVKQAREQGAAAMTRHQQLTLGYVHQLLQIIAQYHGAGVIHKDIKPDNLIVNGERIYLVDIGLLTPLASMAQLTTHGTEYFRDPEMVKLALEGREVREVDAAKFDIYSIGAVLFFAMSGEFPTAGALSRMPAEVPLAVQWVVNRAMTAMHQRYSDARAMLTDVDYLCFAASQGRLHDVKPADLPSFRGMPVPAHLQAAPAQAQDTQARERVSSIPGGYGAWYRAPHYRRRDHVWGPGAVIGVIAAVLGGVVAVSALWLKHAEPEIEVQVTRSAPRAELVKLLPPGSEDLAPVYLWLEKELRHPVRKLPDTEVEITWQGGVQHTVGDAPVSVASFLISAAELRRNRFIRDLEADPGTPAFRHSPLPVIVLASWQDTESDLFAAAVAQELAARAPGMGLESRPPVSREEAEELRALVVKAGGLASHIRLAERAAQAGELPPVIGLIERSRYGTYRIQVVFPGTHTSARIYVDSTDNSPAGE
jgi:serine/threonine protein kinase